MTIDLRLGRWQDTLRDVESCNVIYSDPPYSPRTHDGYRSGYDFNRSNRISYRPLTMKDVREFVDFWRSRVQEWVILHCDHITYKWWESAWSSANLYTFQPVPWIKVDAGPRSVGDGPAVGVEYLFVARTKGWPKVRKSRPPYYLVQVDKSQTTMRVVGKKRAQDVRRVLLDYSSAEDLVIDPFAGTSPIGVCCVELGRSYIGAEADPGVHVFGSHSIKEALKADRQVLLIEDERRMRQTGLEV